MKNKKDYFLWKDLPEPLWAQLSGEMQTTVFSAGEVIFPTERTERCLCLLESGSARVFAQSRTPEHAVLLRTMDGGALFGVHCVFSALEQAQSCIVAQKECQVLLIPAAAWERILMSHPPTMQEYVKFLTRRIQFLNQKIRYLTAGGAECRLALYLHSAIPCADEPTTLPHAANALADLLNLSRASLYRAFTKLSEDGFLERSGHRYILHRREELVHFYG